VAADGWPRKLEAELDRITGGIGALHPLIRESVRYALLDAGKRVRPSLVRMFCEAFGGTEDDALACGCAVEMIHTYSLIHDDLPCMDDDDLRRGKPSCHRAFGEATALLAGDALQALAFETIMASNMPDKQKAAAGFELARLCGAEGMVGGQIVDLQSEGQKADAGILKKMHRGKTCALIEAACVMGAHCAGIHSENHIKTAREYANNVGMAFQIVDDILDVTSTTERLGKPAGSDWENHKSTYVSIFGLERAGEMAKEHTAKAVAALAPLGEKGEELRRFAQSLLERIC